MKIPSISIALIFGLFAILQYNDPDYYIWIPVYGSVSFLAFSKAVGRPKKFFALLLAIGLGVWMMTYIPSIVDWIQMGMPNIAGSMKAESPHIELVREFLGLFMCFAAAIFYTRV